MSVGLFDESVEKAHGAGEGFFSEIARPVADVSAGVSKSCRSANTRTLLLVPSRERSNGC